MESDSRLPTGEWNGFYLEEHQSARGWMHLYLSFENGAIKGEGTDYVGPWTATGRYDIKTGECAWIKQYLRKHQVEYSGRITAKGIQGAWRIGFKRGPFHIWPRGMTELNELYLQHDLQVPTSHPAPANSPFETVEEDELAVIE